MRKLMLVVGARPNFMKVGPLIRAIEKDYKKIFRPILVHTGQHYDPEMSDAFFRDLQIPKPDYNLDVGSATHGVQTARIMERFEPICEKESPACIVVFGDVNSTLACALVGAKNHLKVAHVEAGLRSFDRAMPEEINRVVTDVLSDFLFATDTVAVDNLKREGIEDDRIFRVGDIMVDALFWGKEKASRSGILERLNLATRSYAVATLHRAGNVDDRDVLTHLIGIILRISRRLPVVFPVHPRTEARLKEFQLLDTLTGKENNDVHLIKPVGYIDFLKLIMDSRFVLTDSGGLQKETTLLGVDCLTVRETTEWPLTVSQGTNTLLGRTPEPETVVNLVDRMLSGEGKKDYTLPELWDGRTSERILNVLRERLA